MASDQRSKLSFVIALSIILGSAGVGWWRGQRQDAPVNLASSDSPAAPEPGDTPPANEGEAEEDETADSEPLVDDSVVAVEDLPPTDVSAEQLAQMLDDMRREQRDGHLLEPIDQGAFAIATRILAVDPENAEARATLGKALAELRDAGTAVLPKNLLKVAEQALALLPEEIADEPDAVSVRSSVERTRALHDQIRRGERLAAREGAGPRTFARAIEAYRAALLIDPANTDALRGFDDVQRRMLERAIASAYDLRFATANTLLDQAEQIQAGSSRVLDARSQVMAFRAQAQAQQLASFKDAVAANDIDAANKALEVLRKVLDDAGQIKDLERKVVNVRLYGGFAPGERFGDTLANGGRGPRMVVVPVGELLMGSPDTEPGHNKNEQPQRPLRFDRGFALARNEISVAEFRAFIEAADYHTDAEKSGSSAIYDEKTGRMSKTRRMTWQRSYNGGRARDNDPVVHVSWNDAQAFAEWLRGETGKTYRLPTEAEFEYALRAGGNTAFPWGEGDPPRLLANLAGAGEISKAGRRWSEGFPGYDDGYWGPAPVRSFDANAFRLHDLDGNVSEWVADCWHDNYLRAPETPIAWVNAGCELRVIRGGSWGSAREQVRSAWRSSALVDSSGARVGFRVAREL